MIQRSSLLHTASALCIRSFAAPIEKDQDEERLQSLRRITAPFIIRRMKSDPAVAADLPAKVVQDVQATLSPPQAALYQQVLAAHESDLEKSKGAVLKLITALKQARVVAEAAPPPSPSGSARACAEIFRPQLASSPDHLPLRRL